MSQTSPSRSARRLRARRLFDQWGGLLVVILVLTLWIWTRIEAVQPPTEPSHSQGNHGGSVISLAGDRYHAEALIEEGGLLRLFTLGRDPGRIIDVEKQSLRAYVRSGETEAVSVELVPDPQPGDRAGRTSQFTGQLPEPLRRRPVEVSVPGLRVGSERYRLAFAWPDRSHAPEMPPKRTDAEERGLYLTPGGRYTEADIAANGRQTASQKFLGFRASHDFNPQPGDPLCPVTRTRANPECDWIIDGRRYEFCCPPCVDEFVSLAKEQPDQVLPPEAYVMERD